MRTLLKKLLLSFLSILIVFFSVAPYFSIAKAQDTTWYNQGFGNWFNRVYDDSNPSEIFGERYTAAQVQWVVYGIWSFIINFAVGPKYSAVIACMLGSVGANQDLGACLPEAISNAETASPTADLPKENLWQLVFADRPLSGISYIREKIKNFDLVPVAHAQTVGFGFDVLKPIQDMWRAVRDISFGLFVLVAIIFAFMIMFRVKLSPQTVISVQSAIPKMIFALILVTFSYAIAGFLIDLMYVVIGIVSLIAAGFIPVEADFIAPAIFNLLTRGQPLGMDVAVGAWGLMAIYLVSFFVSLIILLIFNVGLILSGLAGVAFLASLATPIGGVLILLAFLIYIVGIIVVIWTFIKTIWALLKAFVNILLLTIFAPLQLTAGIIIPNFGFGAWLRSFASNLAVFVVTGVLLLFALIFLGEGVEIGYSAVSGGNSIFDIPAFLRGLFGASTLGVQSLFIGTGGSGWPPLLGFPAIAGNIGGPAATGLLFLGVSFVLFTLIPKSAEIIQGLISGRPFAYGTAIGEAFGGVGFAYNRTIGPGVAELERYRSQVFLKGLFNAANNYLENNPRVKKALGPVGDFVSSNAGLAGYQPK